LGAGVEVEVRIRSRATIDEVLNLVFDALNVMRPEDAGRFLSQAVSFLPRVGGTELIDVMRNGAIMRLGGLATKFDVFLKVEDDLPRPSDAALAHAMNVVRGLRIEAASDRRRGLCRAMAEERMEAAETIMVVLAIEMERRGEG